MTISNDNRSNRTVTESVAPQTGITNVASMDRSDDISITFSEVLDPDTVTINTINTSCSGTIQVSVDNFNTCVQMGSGDPTTSNNITFVFNPSGDLAKQPYKLRITGVKDTSGNIYSETTTTFTPN